MKQQIGLLVILLTIIINCYGQELAKPNDTTSGREVFIIVEEMPEFPGGENARQKFLAQNVRYTAEAMEQGIEGTVYASFIIEKDGTITNIQTIKGMGYGLDEEVVRVLKLMPAWQPGKQKGVPVRVKINLPVKFSFK